MKLAFLLCFIMFYIAEILMPKNIKAVSFRQRYVIINLETGEILDDANGWGYKTPQSAHRGFSYKLKKG